ncbi:MAG: DUF4340 domain-containing protein [Deltaproteobacteria bacterium]|nr:DUF4340 domain-containing protein [Deltaproteobacteria bacterium]
MKRSTVIALAVFIALLVSAVMLLTQKPERGITRVSLTDINIQQIDRIVFNGKNAAEIKRQANAKWFLDNGKLADNAAVERLLESLVKINSSNLLTRDPNHYAEYETDDEKGTKLTAYSGAQKVIELTVGKNTSNGLAIRIDNSVYAVNGVYSGAFVRKASDWLEKRVFAQKIDEAKRLEIKLANSSAYALIKKDNSWSIENPDIFPKDFRFDANAASSLVSNVVNLRLNDFIMPDPGVEKTGLGDDANTLSITFSQATTNASNNADSQEIVKVLRIGKDKEKNKEIYAKLDGSDDIFTLAVSSANRLLKPASDLRDLKLLQFDITKVKKLSIKSTKVNLAFAKNDTAWTLVYSNEKKPANFALDPMLIERRVNLILNLRATRLATAKENSKSGLAKPTSVVTVELNDGSKVNLRFGREFKDENKEAIFAQGNIDNATYVLNTSIWKNLLGGIVTFNKQPESFSGGMPNLDPQTLAKLPPDVREQLIKQMMQKQREQQLIKQLETNAAQKQNTPTKP